MKELTAYALLMNAAGAGTPGMNGAIEIEDPAVRTDKLPAVSYKDQDYTKADDIHLGIASGAPSGLVHAAGTAVNFTAQPSDPFKPRAFIVPSSHSWQLYVQAIRIGSFNAIDGDAIPAEAHSEVSLSQQVNWPTIQANQPIIVTMFNGAPWQKQYSLDLRGTRVRP